MDNQSIAHQHLVRIAKERNARQQLLSNTSITPAKERDDVKIIESTGFIDDFCDDVTGKKHRVLIIPPEHAERDKSEILGEISAFQKKFGMEFSYCDEQRSLKLRHHIKTSTKAFNPTTLSDQKKLQIKRTIFEMNAKNHRLAFFVGDIANNGNMPYRLYIFKPYQVINDYYFILVHCDVQDNNDGEKKYVPVMMFVEVPNDMVPGTVHTGFSMMNTQHYGHQYHVNFRNQTDIRHFFNRSSH